MATSFTSFVNINIPRQITDNYFICDLNIRLAEASSAISRVLAPGDIPGLIPGCDILVVNNDSSSKYKGNSTTGWPSVRIM